MAKMESSAIYEHVKKENLLSKSEYNKLQNQLFCDKDTTVYRGLSFRTKKDFEKFIETLKSGEYRPISPESFSRTKSTADEFARQRKTFFFYQDTDLALENNYKNITNENLSSYAGIIIKTIIPKGKGVDVAKTSEGLEDEIIFQSDNPINYSYEVIESFENQLKKNPVNINTYIQDNEISDALSKYLIANHSEELNKESQLYILEETLKPLSLKGDNTYFISDFNKTVVASEIDHSYRNLNKLEIRFHFPNILSLYKNKTITNPVALAALEQVANSIVDDICEFVENEYNYGDREEDIYYDLSYVSETSHLSDSKRRERLKSINFMSSPKNYNEINEEIRELNYRDDLSQEEKRRMFDEKSKEIKDFIENTLNNIPKSKSSVNQKIEDSENRKSDIKKRINKLRNS